MAISSTESKQLSSFNFWRLFHSFLRQDSSSAEIERSRDVLNWVGNNLVHLRKICIDYELDFVNIIWRYFADHKEAPRFEIFSEIVEQKEKNEGMRQALIEYSESRSTLVAHDSLDLGQLLQEKTEEFQIQTLAVVLEKTRRIATGSVEDKKSGKILSGSRDAIQYLLGRVQNGMMVNGQQAVGGDLKEVVVESKDDYEKNKRERESGTLSIRTGIRKIDNVLQIKRQDFVGILGFAGQRKSSLGRTITYQAAQQGFTSVHISLEQRFEEERDIYLIIHSHHPKFGRKFNISKKALDDGALTLAEEDFLFGEVQQDLIENVPGSIILKKPSETSWEAIKAEVEFQNKIRPIDMLFLDYLTLVDVSGLRDPLKAMSEVIKDAKSWALNFSEGRSIALLTPVQGNREGYDEASLPINAGRWRMSGVFQYSEFDKSLDICISTWSDEATKKLGKMTIGSVKLRRAGDIPPFWVKVEEGSGLITDDDGITETIIDRPETIGGDW